MTPLSKRVLRLESKQPDDRDRVEILLINFVDRAPDDTLTTRAGFAQFIGWNLPQMHPEDGESDEAFKARAEAALVEAKAGRVSLSG